ncbi:MAG: ABC transporter permease subunit [Clostridiales bacterium]|jgi:putative aldouronate transport system permease protein|nr:ABC transporter permease subunit [Clostridiales bacterium]
MTGNFGVRKNQMRKYKREIPLYFLVAPAMILVGIYSYGAMAGIGIAFQKFVATKGLFGSEWIGLTNFKTLFALPDFLRVLRNTVFIAFFKMIGGIVVPVIFALLLNEVKNKFLKRSIQTMVYLPNFLSWVILAGIFVDILSPSTGIVGRFIASFGLTPPFFIGDPKWFPGTMIITDIWKTFGFGSVIYLAALTGIDPTLYESAVMDGANRWKQTLYITIPGITSTVILMTVLSMANILNGGFDQIFNMYSPSVYPTGDIIDTFVYRLGIQQTKFAISTAAGLFKSCVSLVFILASYWLADKAAGYRIF